jgi:hypothetical protein
MMLNNRLTKSSTHDNPKADWFAVPVFDSAAGDYGAAR